MRMAEKGVLLVLCAKTPQNNIRFLQFFSRYLFREALI